MQLNDLKRTKKKIKPIVRRVNTIKLKWIITRVIVVNPLFACMKKPEMGTWLSLVIVDFGFSI